LEVSRVRALFNAIGGLSKESLPPLSRPYAAAIRQPPQAAFLTGRFCSPDLASKPSPLNSPV